MSIEVLDPTHESVTTRTELPARPATLVGATVGFISNGKEGTKGFFAHLDRQLRERFGVASVVLRTKPNYSAPAPAALIVEAGAWDLAITGLGD